MFSSSCDCGSPLHEPKYRTILISHHKVKLRKVALGTIVLQVCNIKSYSLTYETLITKSYTEQFVVMGNQFEIVGNKFYYRFQILAKLIEDFTQIQTSKVRKKQVRFRMAQQLGIN